MRIVVRIAAALTVLLSMALMAVSAYAARTTPLATPEPPQQAAEATPTAMAEVAGNDRSPGAAGPVEAEPAPVHLTDPLGTTLRFAPDSGSSLRLGDNASGDLSFGVRVWSVPSIRTNLPGPGGSFTENVPPDQLVVMQQTATAFGLPWQLLAAIARVESDFGRNMAVSTAGAIGYGQFLPVEWEIYGAGGDPYDYHDALLAMARYLVVAGAPADIPDAVYAYNHSWEYVELVLSYATTYGYAFGVDGGSLIWPVIGPISSYFGPDHPLGIDIDQTETPHADVWSAQAGTVVFAGGDPCCSYGNYVIVAGGNGIATLYGHLDAITVEQGQHVDQGETLGIVGCTGHCTGPHVHFEVIVNGERRNPLDYLPGGN
jgi:murein DD-endopeptidase MepM/ murein hydrolase activator NlpD